MKLTTRLSRRIVAGVSLAAAAILLPTAALASSAASSAASGSAAGPAGTCAATATRLWYAVPSEGAAGSSYWQIELSNVGHTTCTFFGYPGVSALDIHGHQVGLAATHSGGRVSATLPPGGTAHFVLRVVDAGAVCAHPVRAVLLRVFGPGQLHSNIVGFPSEQCRGKSLMSVDSVHPGTGIPGFTIR